MPSIERVVIIGGGIVGTATAWYLARAGHKVVLLERDAVARGTTAKNTGVLSVASRPLDHRATLAQFGRALYEELRTDLKADLMFDQKGTMVVLAAGTGATMADLEGTYQGIQAQDVAAELLEADEVRRRAPGLRAEIVGAVLDPTGTLVDAAQIARALAADAASKGAEVREYEPVRAVLTKGGRVTGVCTDKGEVKADAVIVAAGIWSPFVTDDLGIKIPVVPRRGQVLITEETQVVSNHLIQSATYVLDKTAGERANEDPMPRFRFSFTLQQHTAGHCVLGSTREFAGLDERLTDEGRDSILTAARTWFPDAAGLRIDREVAGLRPWTPDHHPIIGPSSRVDGLWYATGHEGDGINMAPVTGRMIAAQMAGQTPEVPGVDLRTLSPDRFGL